MMYKLDQAVEIISVDMNGLLGREPHPPKYAAGRMGTVISEPRYEFYGDDEPLTFYVVEVPSLNARYEFADYELN